MHKHILFFLLVIANTSSYGMKRSSKALQCNNVINHEHLTNSVYLFLTTDLLSQFTAGICSSNNYQPQSIKKNIRALSDTNKFFHDHYAQEKVKQEIIDLCLPHHNSNSKDIAWTLGCRAIHDKLERLTDIVRNQNKELSEDDLVDPWYFSATTTYSSDYNIYQEPLNQSLLYIAIDYWNLEIAITILDNTKELRFDYSFEQNPLLRVAEQRAKLLDANSAFYTSLRGYSEPLFTIAEKLLKKDFLPDGHTKEYQHIPLSYAVQHADKELVQLLLQYGADPYLITYNHFIGKKVNAFDLEPEQGWLQHIINEANANKLTKTTHSPTDQSVEK
jgi:hypothetical protein